jgi:hypothetical protein
MLLADSQTDDEEALTKTQRRRRLKKRKRDAAINLLHAQLAAATATSAGAAAAAASINENFSVESAVPGASYAARAPTHKNPSNPVSIPSNEPSDTSLWITVESNSMKRKRSQPKRRMFKTRGGGKMVVMIARFKHKHLRPKSKSLDSNTKPDKTKGLKLSKSSDANIASDKSEVHTRFHNRVVTPADFLRFDYMYEV